MKSPVEPEGTLLVDSGVDDHICRPSSTKEFPSTMIAGPMLRDVQGDVLPNLRARHVDSSWENFCETDLDFDCLARSHQNDPTKTIPGCVRKNSV